MALQWRLFLPGSLRGHARNNTDKSKGRMNMSLDKPKPGQWSSNKDVDLPMVEMKIAHSTSYDDRGQYQQKPQWINGLLWIGIKNCDDDHTDGIVNDC
mmetsp:Transcript_143909/g.268109  ORF Transcript_143909/g.268109 Transcript_143909/m.268109 type:complete len:98 (-) Transcript_143909:1065-1358(-)